MKKGWTYKKLGEVALEMYRGSGIKRDQVTKEGTPCVRYGEIYTSYNYAFDECVSHTNENCVTSPKYFSHGDLLFAITGESVEDIGKTIAYLGHDKCLLGGDIVCMKHEQNPKYLAYALSSRGAIRQKGLGKTKLKVVHTNIPALSEIRIPIAPLKEQKKIVDRLDAAFAQIDELKANAEKQLAEARALFQKALAKAMEPKEGWEEKTLKEITTKIGSGATPLGGRKVYISEGISLVRSMNVHYNSFKYDELAHINAEAADQLSGVELKQNDVLFNITGASIARCCVLPDEVMPARVNQHVAIIRPITESVTPQFLCLCLISSDYQKELLQIGEAGSTRQALTKADLENFKISLPSLSEQQRIVERLDSISENVRKYEEIQRKIIAECDALKQALLRQVFE